MTTPSVQGMLHNTALRGGHMKGHAPPSSRVAPDDRRLGGHGEIDLPISPN